MPFHYRQRALTAGMAFGAVLTFACLHARGQATASTGNTDRAALAYVAGVQLLQKQELAAAQTQFDKAAKLAPARQDYAMASTMTRDHRVSDLVQRAAKLRMLDKPAQAESLLAEAHQLDPKNELVLEHELASQTITVSAPAKTKIVQKDVLYTSPVQIQPDSVSKELHLRGDAKQVLTQAAASFGVKVSFDGTLNTEGAHEVRFNIDKASYEQTMPILLRMTHAFGVPVNKKLLLIAQDTQENRMRLERQVEETIYVPGSTTEQLNELTQIVKNVFDVKQVVVGATSGTILLRAPASAIGAVNETLRDLIDGGPEVTIEVKLLAVDKMRTVNTGVNTPTSAGIFSVQSEAQSLVTANQALINQLIASGGYVPTGNAATDVILEALYLVLSGAVADAKVSGLIALAGNGLGLTGIYLGSGVTMNLALNSSDTKALDDITTRVGDRQTSTIKVGERYPIETAIYSSGVSSATTAALNGVTVNGVSASSLLNQYLGSSAATSIPQIEYEDLGITLKTTPTVLRSGMIDMKIDMKLESLEGASLNGIPLLNSTVVTSDITLPDGISGMMISNLTKTEAASIQGLPGFGELPGFQGTVADKLKDVDTSELVVVVTPHIVRHRKDLMASRVIPFTSAVPQEY